MKLGITPKPSVYGAAAPKKEKRTWWAANSWWVFTLCGFMLAIMIGLSVSGDDKTADSGKRDNPAQNDERKVNDNREAEDNTYPVYNVQQNDISGTWVEQDPQASVFEIRQNGNSIDAKVYLNNQLVSEGVGTIDQRNVLLKIDLFGVVTLLNLTVSPDRMYLNGNYTVQLTGDSQPIQLKKQTSGTRN